MHFVVVYILEVTVSLLNNQYFEIFAANSSYVYLQEEGFLVKNKTKKVLHFTTDEVKLFFCEAAFASVVFIKYRLYGVDTVDHSDRLNQTTNAHLVTRVQRCKCI